MNDLTLQKGRRMEVAEAHRGRVESSLADLERDSQIRSQFHLYLKSRGYAEQMAPPSDGRYKAANISGLWDCFLFATLIERNGMP